MKFRALCVACLVPLSAFADGGLPDKPYLYVEGKAEIEKAPELVTLRFDLVARNADQAKANQEVQTKAGKIFSLFDDRKIAQGDVVATDLKSEPQYEGGQDYSRKGKLIGYMVIRNFVVKVRDLNVFPKLVDDLLTIGTVEFSTIDAGLSKEKEVQDEVWDKAITNAREKADETLIPLGMKIDSVFAVSPVTFPDIRQRVFGSSSVGEAVTERVIVSGPSQYRVGPVAVSQSVHVIYLISPR